MLHISNMAKRVAVSLNKEQLRILRSMKFFGKKDAEIVKAILLAYISEKGYLEKVNKKRK